jgi:endo-1,4-beta-mannosidase
MAMWSYFDPEAIDADLARIQDAGLSSVRFFLLWETFQPEPDRIDADALAKLERFLDLLEARKLRGIPTLFCGHMSGVNWLPDWTLEPGRGHGRFRTISEGRPSPFGIGDFYAPGPLLAAQRYAVRTIGTRLRGHPAIAMWDLGNEFSNLREPTSPAVATTWSRLLSNELFVASLHPVTGGIHGEDLERDRHIRPSSIAESWEVATMHGYSVYSGFARDRMDAEVVPFLADVVASFTGKSVLFSEFGNPECPPGARSAGAFACLDEAEMARYAGEVLDRLQRRGALGASWWCYSDYDEKLATTPPFDLAPHEMRFGAWRTDGTPKPVVATLSRFAAEGRPVAARPMPSFDEAEWYAQPMRVEERYETYLARVAGG